MRRWDQKRGDPKQGGLELGHDNAALIVEGADEDDSDRLTLEDRVRFQSQPNGTYRTSDYYCVPAEMAVYGVFRLQLMLYDVQWHATYFLSTILPFAPTAF